MVYIKQDESATDVEITHEPQTKIVDGANRAAVPAGTCLALLLTPLSK